MIRRYGTYAAMLAVLLQVFTPALAALTPTTPMDRAMTSMNEPCAHDGEVAATAMHLTTSPHGDHGCCCHGLWSCVGPCGAAALTATAPLLPIFTPPTPWRSALAPRKSAAVPFHPLRPPIAA